MTEKQARILIILFLALLIILAAVNFPYIRNDPGPRPKIYIVSVSTFSEYEGDVWIVDYALDGVYNSVRIPITKSPQGYLDYLSRIGDMED